MVCCENNHACKPLKCVDSLSVYDLLITVCSGVLFEFNLFSVSNSWDANCEEVNVGGMISTAELLL